MHLIDLCEAILSKKIYIKLFLINIFVSLKDVYFIFNVYFINVDCRFEKIIY